MIKLAKLSERHLTDITQVIYYGENANNADLKLLELNGVLLSAIEEGQVLSFKGEKCIELERNINNNKILVKIIFMHLCC